jgi:Secretion system C-terminal sorting domain
MKRICFTKMMFGLAAVSLLPFGAGAQGIHIGTGSRMVITGSPTIVINNGGLINDGTFTAGGSTVMLTGTAGPAISGVGGAGTLAFNTLSINKTSGDVQLNRDITLNGQLIMNGGNFQLNRHTIDLGFNGLIVNESELSHIAGIGAGRVQVKANLESNSPVFFDPGGVGLALISDKDGTFSLVRQNTQEPLPGGGKSILRNYSIIGPAGAHLKYNLKYLNAELNGNAEQSLVIYSTDRFGDALTGAGRKSIDTIQNVISLDTILFGHITAGPGAVTGSSAIRNTTQANAAAFPADGNDAGIAKAYPNPAHNLVTIELVGTKQGLMVINLYDQSGHLMDQKRINAITGKNTFMWDLGKFPAGVYLVAPEGMGTPNVKIIKD